MQHLLDPAIADPTPVSTVDMADFWVLFQQWLSDRRFRLGLATYDALTDFYSTKLSSSASHYVPSGMRASVHETVLRALSQHPETDDGTHPVAGSTAPAYLGPKTGYRLLLDDLSSDYKLGAIALGTSKDHWPAGTTTAVTTCSRSKALDLFFEPHSPTPDELIAKYTSYFSGHSFLIVGGQVDQNVITQLSTRLGIQRTQIVWEPCEHSQKPRNLDSQIVGLSTKSAQVISITGKMGHSTSLKIKVLCQKTKVSLIEIESASSMYERLTELV